ncbi:uncharacterized protein LOC142984154 isoform X2 [Anticarsia gemmatalis]|uniref:uncharacterized protein LOC142984154 isoform X2 n=1 Tax=Anticarsia gemmatalis TaxID=129554 RepID=UPI003F76D1A1
MSANSLENEDLENVPLVRMEDVQPSRERTVGSRSSSKDEEEVYETCIIDGIEYENECIVNDDEDSNIGSMVSLQSEDVYEEDESSQELIIPEVLEEVETGNDEEVLEKYVNSGQQDHSRPKYLSDEEIVDNNQIETLDELEALEEEFGEAPTVDVDVKASLVVDNDSKEYKVNPKEFLLHTPVRTSAQSSELVVPDIERNQVEQIRITPASESWPTLEILPGGVIKTSDKYESDSFLYPEKVQETETNTEEMMYACAKCSQAFKYLFCLVKHVKWHEDQKKVPKDVKLGRPKAAANQYICLHSGKKKIVASERNKRKAPKRLKS